MHFIILIKDFPFIYILTQGLRNRTADLLQLILIYRKEFYFANYVANCCEKEKKVNGEIMLQKYLL
jgi:hypothetical protein